MNGPMPVIATADEMMRYYGRQIRWLKRRHMEAKGTEHQNRIAGQIVRYKAKLAYLTLAES